MESKFHAHCRTRFVAYNPGVVRTGMADQMRQPLRMLMKTMLRIAGKPVAKALPPILDLFDNPPEETFTAWSGRRPVKIARKKAFNLDNAMRLYQMTERLLDGDLSA
jgi:hypothetical protein